MTNKKNNIFTRFYCKKLMDFSNWLRQSDLTKVILVKKKYAKSYRNRSKAGFNKNLEAKNKEKLDRYKNNNMDHQKGYKQ